MTGTYFFAVGNRDPRKNLVRLIEAYGQLSPQERRAHPLLVAGGGASISRSEKRTWPDGAVDAGYVTDEELAQLYRGARSVVFVSKAEGFGLPIVEAAAAGARSLLLSDIDVFRWICGPHARYVNPSSTTDIRDGLRAEIDHPQQQELNLERFDWDVSASVISDACTHAAA